MSIFLTMMVRERLDVMSVLSKRITNLLVNMVSLEIGPLSIEATLL